MSMPPIFITGMHRSGTSLLTQIVGKLGVFTGNKRDINYETLLLIACNEVLLHSAKASWDKPRAFARFIEQPDNMQKAVELLQQQLSTQADYLRDFLGHEGMLQDINVLWGAKDPRLTFTLPVWKKLFPDMKLLAISRNQQDVATSLTKRQREILKYIKQHHPMKKIPMDSMFKTGEVVHTMRCMTQQGSLDLWEEYACELTKRIAENETNHLAITYEDLLINPTPTIKDIAAFCDTDASKELIESVASLVRRKK